jgi:hypothetical protein
MSILRRLVRRFGRTRIPNQKPFHPKLLVEELEDRNLLSGVSGVATPDYVRLLSSSVSPFGTPGPTGYTPAQIRQAYGFNQISFNGVSGDSTGETIAIVDAYDDPTIASDLHQFDLQFGLADPAFTKVNQNGGSSLPAANADWAAEISLDVEWAHAIAPGAKILLVEASSASYSNLLAGVRYAARQTGVAAVSMSWGGSEFASETSLDSAFTTPSGHSGVTFVAASGDEGAPASYPSTSPNVLAVGGTSLYLSSAGSYLSELAWSGSGGGISAVEAQPSYQNGVVTQSSAQRANPDVAYNADPNTGYPVYDSYTNGASTPWAQYGGTSAPAPQWAALIAIADQGRAQAGLGALDGASQTLPMLYGLPSSDFHDITSGTTTGSPRYSATTGYDLATGRGSPYANRVVADLVGSSSTGSQPSSTPVAQETFSVHSDNTVYGQKYDANGNPIGSPFLVASGSLKSISVTRDAAGNLVLFGVDPYLGHVWELKFDANGDPTSSAYTPVWTGGSLISVAAGHDGHGNVELFAVDPFIYHVWAMKFDSSDNLAGPFQSVSAGGVATTLTVGHDGNGNPLVFTVDPYFSQVQELKFDTNGNPVGDFFRPTASFTVKSIALGYDGSGNPELFAVDPYFGHVFYLNFDANAAPTNSIFLQAGTSSVLSLAVSHDANNNPWVFAVEPNNQVASLNFNAGGKPVGDFVPTGASTISVTSIKAAVNNAALTNLFGISLGDNQVYEETFDASGNVVKTFFRVATGAVQSLAVPN